jgi:hypothetical protein
MSNKYCIVIPIYKTKLNEYETLSLKQCCKILLNYHITFIAYKKLDCSEYIKIICNTGISFSFEYFNKIYFLDVSCYNALLLSYFFYKRFKKYSYILIYQLDAYVFSDELDFWCRKGYDYIGAPWLRLSKEKTMPEFIDPPAVGNGGLSLRNVNSFIKKHTLKFSILSFIHLFQFIYNKISYKSVNNKLYFIPRFFLRFFLFLLKFLFFKYNDEANNEDKIWANIHYKSGVMPSIPEAVQFSFELFPEYLFVLNNKVMPFGCHAWYNYHNYHFFKNHITCF